MIVGGLFGIIYLSQLLRRLGSLWWLATFVSGLILGIEHALSVAQQGSEARTELSRQ